MSDTRTTAELQAEELISAWVNLEHAELRLIGKSKDQLPRLKAHLAQALTAHGDQRAREARAAAIEEAAKTYRYIIAQCGIPDPDEACRQILATCLRALTDVPPRPEGGEG
jgi:hypothetical protein